MRLRHRWVLSAALLLGACASPPPQPESMRDPNANWPSYVTYGWASTPALDSTDQPLLLLDQYLRRAIAAEMQRRGYVESTTNPDLRVVFETASAEKVENNPVRVGVGVGSWSGNFGGSIDVGSPSLRNYREGTLVIHAVDAAHNAEVWQGRISTRLGKGSTEPAAIAAAVATAMGDFPARQGRPEK